MRKTILVVTALLAALAAYAAPPADNVVSVPTPPTGACREGQTLVLAKSNGHVYGCVSGAWHDWTAAALAAVNVNSITGDVSVTGVVKAGGGVDLNGDGTPELSRGSTPEGGGGPAPSVVLRGTAGSPALSFWPGYASLDAPLRVPSLDLTGDATDDLTTDGSGHVVLHGVADVATHASAADDAAALGGVLPSGYVLSSTRGAAGGVAALGSDGKVPSAQLPTLGLTGVTSDGTTFDVSAANGEWLKFTTGYGVLTPRVVAHTDMAQSDGSNCWAYFDVYPRYPNGDKNGGLVLSLAPAMGNFCGRTYGYGSQSIIGRSVPASRDSYFLKMLGLQNGVFTSMSSNATWDGGGFNFSAIYAADPASTDDWTTVNGSYPAIGSIFSSWNGSSTGRYWSSRRKFFGIFADSQGAYQRIQGGLYFAASPETSGSYRDSMLQLLLQPAFDRASRIVWEVTPYKIRSTWATDVALESMQSVTIKADNDGDTTAATVALVVGGGQSYTFAKPSSACASGNELGIDASGNVVCRAHPAVEHALSLGGCNGGAYAYGELVAGGAASFDCTAVSTYYRRPVALAPDGDVSTFARVIVPPAQWDGTYTITLAATYGATSGAVHWYEAHACVGDGDAYSAQPTTGTSSTTTVPSTQDRQQTVTLSVSGLSSCAGKTLVVLIGRDGAAADDTMAGTAYIAAAKIAFGAR